MTNLASALILRLKRRYSGTSADCLAQVLMVPPKPRKRGRVPNAIEPVRPEETKVPPARQTAPDQPVSALRRYIHRYDLQMPMPMTLEGFMLRGPVGSHSASGKQSRRSTYGEASKAVNNHLRGGVIKEGDAIAEFLYAVQHSKSEFKLHFGESEKESAASQGEQKETSEGRQPSE